MTYKDFLFWILLLELLEFQISSLLLLIELIILLLKLEDSLFFFISKKELYMNWDFNLRMCVLKWGVGMRMRMTIAHILCLLRYGLLMLRRLMCHDSYRVIVLNMHTVRSLMEHRNLILVSNYLAIYSTLNHLLLLLLLILLSYFYIGWLLRGAHHIGWGSSSCRSSHANTIHVLMLDHNLRTLHRMWLYIHRLVPRWMHRLVLILLVLLLVCLCWWWILLYYLAKGLLDLACRKW